MTVFDATGADHLTTHTAAVDHITLAHNGFVVRGTLERPSPDVGDTVTLALVLPGFMGTQRDPVIRATARALTDAGMASLRIDFIGHGRSDGALIDMTLPDQIAQARRAFEHARALPGIGEIVLVGHSQGGVVATMLAAELGEAVAALVLYAPATIIPDALRAGEILGTHFDPVDPPAAVRVFGARISREYLTTGQRLPLDEAAARYRGPVLIIHGASDSTVPLSASEAFAPTMADARLEVLPRQDHEFLRGPQSAAECAADFLRDALD